MNGGGGTATEEDDSKKYVQREWNCSIFSVGPRRVIYEHGHPQKEWRERATKRLANKYSRGEEGRTVFCIPPSAAASIFGPLFHVGGVSEFVG